MVHDRLMARSGAERFLMGVRESDGLTTRVMTAEHLMAIALQTGRAKDYARLVMFVESGVADMTGFRSILARHSLLDAWEKFENRYLKS